MSSNVSTNNVVIDLSNDDDENDNEHSLPPSTLSSSSSTTVTSSSSSSSSPPPPPPPTTTTPSSPTLRMITWNLDGLESVRLIERTQAACLEILSSRPDVIFLQEVVNESLSIIDSLLSSQYTLVSSAESEHAYFVALGVKKTKVQLFSWEGLDFPRSQMGRHLLFGSGIHLETGHNLLLMTSHLESLASGAEERVNQMKSIMKCLTRGKPPVSSSSSSAAAASDASPSPKFLFVLFAGDTNLRDKEVPSSIYSQYSLSTSSSSSSSLSASASGVVQDAWIALRSPPHAAATWDCRINDNKHMPGANKPFLRFDRVWFNNLGFTDSQTTTPITAVATTATTTTTTSVGAGHGTRNKSIVLPRPLHPKNMRLMGTVRMPKAAGGMFPSDHWGVCVDFEP